MPSEPPVIRTVWENEGQLQFSQETETGGSTYSTLDGELVSSTESEHLGKRIRDDGADQYGYSQSLGGIEIRWDERKTVRHKEEGEREQSRKIQVNGVRLPFDCFLMLKKDEGDALYRLEHGYRTRCTRPDNLTVLTVPRQQTGQTSSFAAGAREAVSPGQKIILSQLMSLK